MTYWKKAEEGVVKGLQADDGKFLVTAAAMGEDFKRVEYQLQLKDGIWTARAIQWNPDRSAKCELPHESIDELFREIDDVGVSSQREETRFHTTEGASKGPQPEWTQHYGKTKISLDMVADPFLFVYCGEETEHFNTTTTEFQVKGEENHRWTYSMEEGLVKGEHRGGDHIVQYAAAVPDELLDKLQQEVLIRGRSTIKHKTYVVKSGDYANNFTAEIVLNARRATNNSRPYGPVFFAVTFEPEQYTEHVVRQPTNKELPVSATSSDPSK